jgi:hypothetical protein
VGKKDIMGGKEIYNKVGKKILMAPDMHNIMGLYLYFKFSFYFLWKMGKMKNPKIEEDIIFIELF